MKITKKKLISLIETVLKEENKTSSKYKKVHDELSKTKSWFEQEVFPAIEKDNWPIIADDGPYYVSLGFFGNLSEKFAIPSGAKFKNLKTKIESHSSMKPHTLYEWYKTFNKNITNRDTIQIFKKNNLDIIKPVDQNDVPVKFLKSSSDKNPFGYEKNKELRTKPNRHLKLPYSKN